MKHIETHAYRLTSDCIWNSFHSSNKKHIIITGSRGSGKTTLLNKLFPTILPGITTWAVPQTGVYLKDNITNESSQVGIYNPALEGYENKMELIGNGFTTLGIQALHSALASSSSWVSIDEIGYLESQCPEFLNMISQIMNHKHLLAVVRKQNLSHLTHLCQREDVFLIDLDASFQDVGCVIMASGLGKRFGKNKLMAEFHNKPLINYILDATANIFTKRVVVTRHEAIADLCKGKNVEVILHSMPHRSDTIRLGLEHLLDTKHCMFCTADQPLLKEDTIAALALLAINAPQNIIRPIFEDKPGSPVVFPQSAYRELLQLPEGKGGGHVIKEHPDLIQYLPVDDKNELEDIDTPEDFLRLQQFYENKI